MIMKAKKNIYQCQEANMYPMVKADPKDHDALALRKRHVQRIGHKHRVYFESIKKSGHTNTYEMMPRIHATILYLCLKYESALLVNYLWYLIQYNVYQLGSMRPPIGVAPS